jgi:hypothetical protein
MAGITKECSARSWIPTSKPATATVRAKPQSVCEIRPSQSSNACRCQDGDYSLGAIVRTSDNSFIRCDRFELGKFTAWRPATSRELGRGSNSQRRFGQFCGDIDRYTISFRRTAK